MPLPHPSPLDRVGFEVKCGRMYDVPLFTLVENRLIDPIDVRMHRAQDINSSMAPDDCVLRARGDLLGEEVPTECYMTCLESSCQYAGVTVVFLHTT